MSLIPCQMLTIVALHAWWFRYACGTVAACWMAKNFTSNKPWEGFPREGRKVFGLGVPSRNRGLG